MNGVVVPDRYKHQMRRERSSPEYIEACIRDYVKARPNVILRGQDFIDALDGLTTAPSHVAKLIKARKLTRKQVFNGQTGASYCYTWQDTPIPVPVHKIKEPHAVDISTTKRRVYATDYELKRINEWFMDYVDTELTHEELAGANKFRKWVHGKVGVEEKETTESGKSKDDSTE